MQMAAMRRLIASGTQLFVSFLHGVKERLARCRAILAAGPGSLRIAEIDEIFQHVHTIKSEARAFDLRALADAASQIEDRLAEVCGLAREGARISLYEQDLRIELRDRLKAAEAAVANARTLFVEASPIGAAVLDQVTVSRSALLELSELIGAAGHVGHAGSPGSVPIEKLARTVSAVMSRPFGESTASIVETASQWASSVGKQVELEVDGREVLIPNELSGALSGALQHLVRNAIAHGIELPEERARLGKPRAGRVRVTCADPGGAAGITIAVEDDGRGLDLEALRAKAKELGIPTPAAGPAELVFSQNVSTAESVSDIAGRGVGLAAVRAELAKIGWAISVQSEPSRGTRFVVTRPRSGLRPGAA
jgi:chemotaxis protein histidine kinase CheA